MKVKAHMRVARSANGRKGYQVDASINPSHAPLYDSRNNPLPTAAFALELEIPEAMLNRAAQVVAEIKVPASKAEIAAQVTTMGDD